MYSPAVEGTETQQAEELELFTGNGELILVVMTKPQFEITKTSLETTTG